MLNCPRCNGPMQVKSGRFGPFYGCQAFPRCKGVRKIDAKAKERDGKEWVGETEAQFPKDGSGRGRGDGEKAGGAGQGPQGSPAQAQGEQGDDKGGDNGQSQEGENMDYRTLYAPTHSTVFWVEGTPTDAVLSNAVKRYLGNQRLPRGYVMGGTGKVTDAWIQLDENGQLVKASKPDSQGEQEQPGESPDWEKIQEKIDEKIEEAKQELEAKTAPQTIKIDLGGETPEVEIENPPALMPLVLEILAARMHPLLIGPTGSGKTYLAEQCAKALGVRFFPMHALSQEYQLTGYTVGQEYVRTAFREGFENGGLVLLDEIDGYWPQPALALNAGLSNGYNSFPDNPEPIFRHSDNYIIGAANTWGHGADREYVGRNQLDTATLRRFVPVEIDYDERVERALGGEHEEWVTLVHNVRRRCRELGIRHYVTTDEIVRGRILIERGNLDFRQIAHLLLKRDMDDTNWARVCEGSGVDV